MSNLSLRAILYRQVRKYWIQFEDCPISHNIHNLHSACFIQKYHWSFMWHNILHIVHLFSVSNTLFNPVPARMQIFKNSNSQLCHSQYLKVTQSKLSIFHTQKNNRGRGGNLRKNLILNTSDFILQPTETTSLISIM